MFMAQPRPDNETGAPEKKPRRSNKSPEPLSENGVEATAPKKRRSTKKSSEAIQDTGTEAESAPKKRRSTKKCPEAVAETGTEVEPTPKRRRAAKKTSEAALEPGTEAEPTTRKRRATKKTLEAELEAGTEAESTPKKRRSTKKPPETVPETGAEGEPTPKKRRVAKKTSEAGVETGTEAEPTPKKRRSTKKTPETVPETGSEPEVTPKPRRRSRKNQSLKGQDGFIATTPVAERLADADIWSNKARKKKPAKKMDTDHLMVADRTRVNIVSYKLCDDIIKYLGPSLDRHRGCDLLDMNPGVGVWSRALHDAVQPRQHIMMEPWAEEYTPFIKEAMGDRQNVKIVPKMGMIWKDLQETLQAHIAPHHTPTSRGQTPERNDSILVTMNVSAWPEKPVYSFPSLSVMVAYQLIRYIRTSSFFQQYGLVRVLLWANNDFKHRILPRSVGERVRANFEAELACEYIHEVAGIDSYDFSYFRRNSRDEWLSYESAARCYRNMKDLGIDMIPGRETRMFKALEEDPQLLKSQKLAGRNPIRVLRPFQDELEKLEQEASPKSSPSARLHSLRTRVAAEGQEGIIVLELLQTLEKLSAMGPSHPEFAPLETEFNNRINGMKRNLREIFYAVRDNYFSFRRNSGPTLLWDRRTYEPLTADPTEFWPNAPVCLLDIQPRAVDPLFHEIGPSSNRSGDVSDILLRTAFGHPANSLPHAMASMWPGFADLVDQCPSFIDPRVGGTRVSGHGELAVRAMSEENWADVVRAWMNWPFRPSYLTLLGRAPDLSGAESQDAEGSGFGGGAMGARNL
ncbi:unnamed protein product [Clonostachys rosea]|uniref:Mitochondrial transcription factor 1 n=1 Tax=Bionectria ochroleuca TaxID=29856 RepID=A0ABY6U0Z5_BIOOC|nr:unnamed protein product [Clonostachys rosea]